MIAKCEQIWEDYSKCLIADRLVFWKVDQSTQGKNMFKEHCFIVKVFSFPKKLMWKANLRGFIQQVILLLLCLVPSYAANTPSF